MTDVAIVGNVYPRVFFGHCHLSCQAREREASSEVVFFRTPPRDVAPIREGAIAGSTTILCVRLLWIGNVEEVGDLILNRQKSLCLAQIPAHAEDDYFAIEMAAFEEFVHVEHSSALSFEQLAGKLCRVHAVRTRA
jgi:hypothetical protein